MNIKILKAPMVNIAVRVWGILSDVITNDAGMLSSKVEGELGSFITLIECTFTNCEATLRDAMQRTEEMMSLKMPVGEMARGPCCEAPYMHGPSSNKDIHERNKKRLRSMPIATNTLTITMKVYVVIRH